MQAWIIFMVLFTVLGTVSATSLRQWNLFSAYRDATVSSNSRLGKFVYHNCGHPDTDIFNLTSAVIKPDPVKLPGTVTIGASFTFRESGQSPVKLEVDLRKKSGDSWLKIPCIAQVGSCTYDDFCDILALINVCPPELVAAGIPCHCPIAKGSYTLPPTKFDIPIPIFPSGDYKLKVIYTSGDKAGGCVEVFISFA